MAKKAAAAPTGTTPARKRPARKRSAPRMSSDDASSSPKSSTASANPSMQPFGDMTKMAKMMTPEQAIELYKANAALALNVINTAIESTARMRKKQFEGEEQAREFQKKHVQSAAAARDPQSLMAAGQGAAQEAMEKSMHYWSEMFDLIVEMQKRLFTMMEDQMTGMPGVKEARAAMSMMPDLRQAQNVIKAMQNVVSSGGNAFESMQRVMGDFAKYMPGMRR